MNNGDTRAFTLQYEHDGVLYVNEGLTKREYFAGLAMQGLLSDLDSQTHGHHLSYGADAAAIHAVKYADALLKALEE